MLSGIADVTPGEEPLVNSAMSQFTTDTAFVLPKLTIPR